jgi:hypothetical protein
MGYVNEPWVGEHCDWCGRGYDDVYSVPDDEWRRVTGLARGEGLLCPACFSFAKEQVDAAVATALRDGAKASPKLLAHLYVWRWAIEEQYEDYEDEDEEIGGA